MVAVLKCATKNYTLPLARTVAHHEDFDLKYKNQIQISSMHPDYLQQSIQDKYF